MAAIRLIEKTKRYTNKSANKRLLRVAKNILKNLDGMYEEDPNSFGYYFGATLHTDLIEAIEGVN